MIGRGGEGRNGWGESRGGEVRLAIEEERGEREVV